jgi:hypothetical protein
MIMGDTDIDPIETIKRRFDFDAWRTRTTLGGSLFVRNLTPRGHEVPGMAVQQVRRTEPAAVAVVGLEANSVRIAAESGANMADRAPRVHVQSIWRDVVHPDVIVRVDVFECISQDDAREKAVWLLGEFESPLVEPAHGVGDVAFGSRQEGVLLFMRANLVYLLRNIGRRAVTTRGAALALDADATNTPAHLLRPFSRDGSNIASSNGSDIVEVTLDEEAAGMPATCRKVVISHGQIYARGTSIVYRGPQSGLDTLRSYEWPGPLLTE